MRILLTVFTLFGIVPLFAGEPEWNQFRGPNHDNKSFTMEIAKSWPEDGPKLLWKVGGLGEGYSNFSFHGDKMFTMGDVGQDCLLIALDRNTGKEIWKVVVGDSGAVGGYRGPRSTPAVDGERVFAFGQFGDFVCVEMESGKELWGGDVVADLGGQFMNNWGFSSSPIFDGEHVLLPVGGDGGTVVAFEKNGRRAWRSKDLKDPAPYGSVVPAVFDGVKQYLIFTQSGLYGLDPKNGDVLWRGVRETSRAVCSDPVFKDDVALVAQAYRMGAHGFRISRSDDKFKAEEIYADPKLLNHHGGMVLVDDHVYLTGERNLFCVNIKTGETVWENRSVGKGSVSYVDGHLIVRAETGEGAVALVEATPEAYREKGRFSQPDRSDKNSWTYPVVVDGKMYIRDQNMLFCYELK